MNRIRVAIEIYFKTVNYISVNRIDQITEEL